MAVEKITMISLPVNDMEQAKLFYTNKLGFEVTKDFEGGGNRWVTIIPPGGGTSITLGTLFEDLKPGTMKMYLSTPDVEVAYKELKAKGVEPINDISDDPWGKWFSVDDPDGNHWLIVQS